MRFRFAGFTLDSELRELRRGEALVRVQPKILDLLLFLLENRFRVVPRDELLRGVWPDVATTDGSLARAVSLAREALGDRNDGGVLATVRGHGYRIAVPVDLVDAGSLGGATAAFVGRERELAELHAAFDRVLAKRAGAIFVAGEPGVGKSRLVEEFARAARARGAETLWGAAHEGEGGPAFWPWTRMLEQLARARDARTLRSLLGRDTAVLATLAPSLARFAGASERAARPRDRLRQFEAIAALLDRASAARPLLLCFDDLHWADEASLQLLAFAATALRASRILVVGTLRETETSEAVAAARASCARALAFACDLRVGGLAIAEVERFLAVAVATPEAAALAPALHARTDGNPFFLQEIARYASDVGSWNAPVPGSVRQAVHLRLRRLSPGCVESLRTASVIGRRFELDLLVRTSGRTATEVLPWLDEAERAAVLAAEPGCDCAFRFAHELIREVLYESLSRPERIAAHRRVAEELEASHARSERPPLAELAYHFGEALVGGDPARAAGYAVRAGEQALAQLAYEQAAAHFAAALRATDALPDRDPRARGEILLRQADAFYGAGATDRAEECAWEVIGLAREAGLVDLFARAAVGVAHRDIGNKGTVPERRVRVLEEALAKVDGAQHGLRARMLSALSADVYWHDLARSEALAREAVAAARRAGDRHALFCALGEGFHFLVLPEQRGERDALSAEMLALALADGDLEGEFVARKQRLEAFVTDGRRAAADAELRQLAALAERTAQPGQREQVRIARAARALWRGERAQAEVLVQPPDAAPCARPLAQLSYAPQLFLLRRMQGRLHELDSVLREGARRFPRVPSFACARAQFLAECGRLDEARACWAQLRDLGALRADANYAIDLAMLAEVCTAVGDEQAAAALYGRLLPHAGTNLVLSTIASLGSADRPLGRLAFALGDLDAAAAHLERAREIEAAMGARIWEAYAERELAAVRARRGDAAAAARHGARSVEISRALAIAL